MSDVRCRLNLNVVVLAGRLAAPAQVEVSPEGTTTTRLLVATASEKVPRRIELIPVFHRDAAEQWRTLEPGQEVFVTASLVRGGGATLQVVASHVEAATAPG